MDDNNLSYLIVNRLHALGVRKPLYRGTFTSDAFLDLIDSKSNFNKKGCEYFAVNTLTSHSAPTEIGHWLGFSLDRSGPGNMLKLGFFDSFAKGAKHYGKTVSNIIKSIQSKCRRFKLRLVTDRLTRPIQAISSKLCGIYVALFIINSIVTKKGLKMMHMFKSYVFRKKSDNDPVALNEALKSYPYCHDEKIYKNLKKPLAELTKPPPFCTVTTLGTQKCYLKDRCKCDVQEV